MASVELRIKRQDEPKKEPYWQTFRVPYSKGMNVITALMEIAKNPVTADGKKVQPVVWEHSCLEEVCGSCAMVINGKARQACSAIVDKLEQPITLEPLSRFPVVRDLVVDRFRIFDHLKKVKAWVPIDGTFDTSVGPKIPPAVQEKTYALSRCITCGCCVESCPQVSDVTNFMGPVIMGQVIMHNMNPIGKTIADQRIEAIMGENGIQNCANAQNCVKACPKHLPLAEVMSEANKQALIHAFKSFFTK